MGENSKIEWCSHTFNPWWGCTKVSPGCDSCYAKRLSKRWGHDLWGPKANRRFMSDAYWRKPLNWNKKAEKAGVRARVFCGSMCDVFEIYEYDKDIAFNIFQERWRLFELINRTPWLEWLLLTKRIQNVAFPYSWTNDWPANVRLGITVVNQEEADRDIPKLLKLGVPNFLSIEPMLGPIDLYVSMWLGGDQDWQNEGRHSLPGDILNALDWIVVGGETGPRARPMHPDWARSIRDQCKAPGVPYFFKAASGRALIPDDLMIREFPNGN